MRWLWFIILLMLDVQVCLAKKGTIVLPLNGWASQRILTKIVGKKITQLGFNVNYLPISSIDQIGALRKGLIHLQIEAWQNSGDGKLSMALNQGYIESAGKHSAQGREDWWYPKYVEKLCPGLPNWQALNACSAIFSDNKNSTKGIFYTGPWNHRDPELVRALKLNFSIKRLKNEEQLWGVLAIAIKKQKPVVLLNWKPSWIEANIEGSFVEFPAYELACKTDPKWGINKTITYDCGNPSETNIIKVVWSKLQSMWPCVYRFIKEVDFSNDMIAQASLMQGDVVLTEEQAVEHWFEKYNEKNVSWLNFSCK